MIRQIRDYTKTPSGAVVLKVPDMIVISKDNNSKVDIAYGTGANDFMEWDAKNSFGVAVTSGVYELLITEAMDTGRVITAAKSVTILNEGNQYLGEIKAVPNPYYGTGPGIEIRWDFAGGAPKPGFADIVIVNMSGEHIKTLSVRLETGKAMWDLRGSGGSLCAAGVYVAIVQARGDDGHTQTKKVKLAIAKALKDN
jgi:hypothetical protein